MQARPTRTPPADRNVRHPFRGPARPASAGDRWDADDRLDELHHRRLHDRRRDDDDQDAPEDERR